MRFPIADAIIVITGRQALDVAVNLLKAGMGRWLHCPQRASERRLHRAVRSDLRRQDALLLLRGHRHAT